MERHVILQDLPAERVALKFDSYARALAGVIEGSKPRFAIGIFGSWGAGKTTLMNEVRRQLTSSAMIKVEFSAWRYEREPNLIVPLLDVIREAMVEWSKADPAREQATATVVRTLGRTVKALLAGFAFKAGVPTALEVSFEASKAIDTWDQAGLEKQETARSLYHACFTALAQAFGTFAKGDPNRRIIVFVDDLDRCLPNGAIEVIEAMKLFFDLPGFVFVVGLDQKVIEASVEIRYRDFNSSLSADQTRVSGEEYIKKIFQVPFSLAPVSRTDLRVLVDSYLEEADAPQSQKADVTQVVLPHLQFVAGENAINPRDVKRFINTYTITHTIKQTLDKNVILALQSMNYRPDWRGIYRSLVAFRGLFIRAVKGYQDGNEDALEDLDDELVGISADFLQYISAGAPGYALGNVGDDVVEYIYAGEALKATGDTQLADAAFELTTVRGKIKDLPAKLSSGAEVPIADVRHKLLQVAERLGSTSTSRAVAQAAHRELLDIAAQLEAAEDQARNPMGVGGDRDWSSLDLRLKKLVPRLIANY